MKTILKSILMLCFAVICFTVSQSHTFAMSSHTHSYTHHTTSYHASSYHDSSSTYHSYSGHTRHSNPPHIGHSTHSTHIRSTYKRSNGSYHSKGYHSHSYHSTKAHYSSKRIKHTIVFTRLTNAFHHSIAHIHSLFNHITSTFRHALSRLFNHNHSKQTLKHHIKSIKRITMYSKHVSNTHKTKSTHIKGFNHSNVKTHHLTSHTTSKYASLNVKHLNKISALTVHIHHKKV